MFMCMNVCNVCNVFIYNFIYYIHIYGAIVIFSLASHVSLHLAVCGGG